LEKKDWTGSVDHTFYRFAYFDTESCPRFLDCPLAGEDHRLLDKARHDRLKWFGNLNKLA
jgi:hypothetical protein